MSGTLSTEEENRGAGDVKTMAAEAEATMTSANTTSSISRDIASIIIPKGAAELGTQKDPPPSSPRLESKVCGSNTKMKKRLSRNERRHHRKRHRPDAPSGQGHEVGGANSSLGGDAHDLVSPAAEKDGVESFTARVVPLELDGQAAGGNRQSSSVPYVRVIQPYPYTFTSFAKKRWLERAVIDVFSSEFQSYPRTYYERAIRMGAITVNGMRVDASRVVRGGDVLRHSVHRHEPAVRVSSPQSPWVRIVANTETCLVVDKPPCLPIHPCGGYHENSLLRILNGADPPVASAIHMIHRLDRLTSGLVVLAKSSETASEWAEAIKSRTRCQKLYVARVKGRFPSPQALEEGSIPCLAGQPAMPTSGEWCDVAEPRRRNAHGWWISNEHGEPCPPQVALDEMRVALTVRSSRRSAEEWLRSRLDVLSKSLTPSSGRAQSPDSHSTASSAAFSTSNQAMHWLHLACPTRLVEPKNGVCGCGTFDELDDDVYTRTVKSAETSFCAVSYHEESDSTLVLCRPQTGRTHQIRLHLQLLGHPIANDPNYGGDVFYYDKIGSAACQRAQQLLNAEESASTDGKPFANFSSLVTSDQPATEQEMELCVGQPARAPDESLESFVKRTCVWCARNATGRDDRSLLELMVRSSGIWLHALQYSVLLNGSTDPTVFQTLLPDWSTLDAVSTCNRP